MASFDLNPDVIARSFPYLLQGLGLTLRLAVVSAVGSLAIGLLLALARMSSLLVLRVFAIVYIDVLRMIPLVMVIFWIFFLLPILFGARLPPQLTMIAALVFYNASYMAEIIRSGIEAVPRGLVEAARASGLGYVRTIRHVVLPLAVGYMLPALTTRLISVVMGTSLAYVIGVPDFFRAAYNVNARVFEPYTIYGFVAVVYFVLCYGLSLIGEYFYRRANRHARNSADAATG